MVDGLTETKRTDGFNDTLIPLGQYVPYSLITTLSIQSGITWPGPKIGIMSYMMKQHSVLL